MPILATRSLALAPRLIAPTTPFEAHPEGDLGEARYLAAHKAANRYNLPRVQGWPPLGSHFNAKRNAQAQGRRAAPGTPCPADIAREGSAWAEWFAEGNGPFRDVEAWQIDARACWQGDTEACAHLYRLFCNYWQGSFAATRRATRWNRDSLVKALRIGRRYR